MAHEAIAAQIEEPFGTEDNDLALNAMSAMIEDAVREMSGEPIPEPGAAAAQVCILD
ncbi:bestrophin family ion channel, partial [Ralstonia solanacearum]